MHTCPTRIKICGLTRREDLEYAAFLGVDAVGLVFQAQSPRRLDPEAAAALLRRRPAFLSVVALFMDAGRDRVQAVLDRVAVDFLQFHGTEAPDFCASFGLPYVKAVPMGSVADAVSYARAYRDTASAFVVDSNRAGETGGTGKTFDWNALAHAGELPLILAGGLTPDNVAEGVRRLRPLAVDVASGVESAKSAKSAGGVKDHRLMREFVAAVRVADKDVGADAGHGVGHDASQDVGEGDDAAA